MPFFTTNGGVEQFHCNSPTKDLMRVLVEKTEAAGRILTSEEFAKYPELPKPNHFAYYFGSFSEAAKQAYANTEHYKNAKMREKSEPKKAYQEAEVRQRAKATAEEKEEKETPNTEEVQVVKHESDSGEVTIEVTIPLNLKKPIKIILIPA